MTSPSTELHNSATRVDVLVPPELAVTLVSMISSETPKDLSKAQFAKIKKLRNTIQGLHCFESRAAHGKGALSSMEGDDFCYSKVPSVAIVS